MARKQAVSIQDKVETNEEFEKYLQAHVNQLICMEVYSNFCGPCVATGNAIRKGKLEIGQEHVAMVKCSSDNIDALARFKDHSEPAFLFIAHGKLIRTMFGPNGIDLCAFIEEELKNLDDEANGIQIERPRLEIHEMLPVEAEKMEERVKIEEEYKESAERLRVLTLAARKKRVNERLSTNVQQLNFIMFWPHCHQAHFDLYEKWDMITFVLLLSKLHGVNERLSTNVQQLNFIMYWPHCHQAHYDLYEKWDMINITVAAKETIQLDEKSAREALYMSDIDLNEACLHALFDGEVLVVLFKMFESDDRDFVQLMRYALYEEIPTPKLDVPPEKQLPPIPAYERYATISKSAREVRRDRYNAKMQKLKEEKESAERLAAEQARLVREAEAEAARVEKQRLDDKRMARIAAGLPAEPEVAASEPAEGEEHTKETEEQAKTEMESEEVPLDVEVAEKVEEFDSDVEVEGEEFIPAGGLVVPGLYTPGNELAKANGLAFFFPKQIQALGVEIETEYLPPHVLVMFNIDKRYEVQEVINQYSSEIMNMGIFVGDDPYKAEHIAYTIKQYDKLIRPRKYFDRLALMVSRKRSLPLLQLAGLNPMYISSDVSSAEKECLVMFPVGYGDEYVEEESVKEEEVVQVEQPVEEPVETVAPAEEKVEEEEEEEEG